MHCGVIWTNYSTRKQWQSVTIYCVPTIARNLLDIEVWFEFSETILMPSDHLLLLYTFPSCIFNSLLGVLGHFARLCY